MSATVLLFVPRRNSDPRQQPAGRPHAAATPSQAASSPRCRPADPRLSFAAGTRLDAPPHPMWRVFLAFLTVYDWVCSVLQPILYVYLLVVTAVAVPFAIVGGQFLVSAFCAFFALMFATVGSRRFAGGASPRQRFEQPLQSTRVGAGESPMFEPTVQPTPPG